MVPQTKQSEPVVLCTCPSIAPAISATSVHMSLPVCASRRFCCSRSWLANSAT